MTYILNIWSTLEVEKKKLIESTLYCTILAYTVDAC